MKKISKMICIAIFSVLLIMVSMAFFACGEVDDPSTNNCVHTFGEWGNSTATCEVAGIEKRVCTICSKEESREVSALGHSFTTYVCDNNADCKTDETSTAHCDNGCGKSDVKVTGGKNPLIHNSQDFVYSVNQNDNTKHDKLHACCNVLAETLSHVFNAYTSNNDATCSIDGTETATCVCGKTHQRTEEGSATGVHDTYIYSIVSPDCENDGQKIEKCRTCSTYQNNIPYGLKLGHSVSSWRVHSQTLKEGTCTYNVTYIGTCSTCLTDEITKIEEEIIHSYVCSITDTAKCNHEGTKTYSCVHGCENSTSTEKYTASEAHAWVKNGDAVNGVQAYTCSNNCGNTKSVIEATSNTFTADKNTLSTNELKLTGNDVSVSVQLDNTTLGLLGSGDVSVSASVLSGTDRANAILGLSEAQKNLIAGKTIYDFTISQNSMPLSLFNGGKVRVAIDYTLSIGEDPGNLVIWHVSDAGVEVFPATYVNGQAVFYATHFSNFVVASVSEKDACLANGHKFIKGAVVEPTCTTAGYTEAVCAHCNTAYITDVVYELGHDYSAEPVKTEKTCTENGKFTYTCNREGCSHKSEIPILASHNYEYHSGKSATCKEGGFTIRKCTDCGDEVTTYTEKVEWHDERRVYELLEGKDSCVTGLVYYYVCNVDGCDYKSDYTYEFTHLCEDKMNDGMGGAVLDPVEIIDLRDYGLADYYSMMGADSESGLIKIYNSTCLCGGVYGRVEFSDSFVFMSGWGVEQGSFSGAYEENLYSNMSGMGGPNQFIDYHLTFKIEEVKDGCLYKYPLTITLKELNSDTAEFTRTYLIDERLSHTTAKRYSLVNEGTYCNEGVLEVTYCKVCEEVLGEYTLSSDNPSTHYRYINTSYDLSVYGTQNHNTKILVESCPCGMMEFEVKKTGYTNYCYFRETVVESTDTVYSKEFVCDCGIRYIREDRKVFDSHCNMQYYTYVSYDYDSTSGTYRNRLLVAITHPYKNHSYKTVETQRGDTCFYDYATHCTRCNEQNIFTGLNAHHITKTEETIDVNGIKTTREGCVNCDYHTLTVTHPSGNLLRRYEVSFDLENNLKMVENIVYKLFEKEYGGKKYYFSRESIRTLFHYDMDSNEEKYWSKTMHVFKIGEEKCCLDYWYSIDSNGDVLAYENIMCDYIIDVYTESTCTKAGASGRLCLYCEGLDGYVMEPQHIMIGDYENGYTCDRCGFESDNMDNYDSVLIEKLGETETVISIGYYNRYQPDVEEIAGTTKTLIRVFNEQDQTYSEQDLTGVTITDNNDGTISINKTELLTVVTNLNLDSGAIYQVCFEVYTEHGNIVRLKLLTSN